MFLTCFVFFSANNKQSRKSEFTKLKTIYFNLFSVTSILPFQKEAPTSSGLNNTEKYSVSLEGKNNFTFCASPIPTNPVG